MNKTKRLIGTIGFVLCSALPGYTIHGQLSASIGVSVPLPVVEIRAESDFYEPLTPHGEWVVIGSYGRCWRPRRVEAGWRPYCNGYWQRTDAGWYWVSDEPWGWATYHYGRWDFSEQYGWYWVPQTQWAPAWVSWHSGGGYVGWAPLLPSVRVSASGYVGFNASLISPRAYVFVEQRRFLEPIRPTTVVVNNTTIINKTAIITNTRTVNNSVVYEGPATTVIEKASGRKLEAVPVREVRQKQEAAVVSRQRAPAAVTEKNLQAPAPNPAQPRAASAVLDAQRRAKESEATAQKQSQKGAKELIGQTPVEPQRRANEAAAKISEPTQSKAKESERIARREAQQPGRELDKNVQADAATKAGVRPEPGPKREQIASEKGGTNTVKKAQKKNGKGKPSSPENPPAPPKSSP
jgi:hypothetical protein